LPSIGENVNFDFLTSLEVVNCNFAQTFCIDSTHQHRGCIKISRVEISCNWKKIRLKFFEDFFYNYFKNGVESLCSICASLRRSGALQTGCIKFGDFLRTFLPEGAEFFMGVSLKVHWNFIVDRMLS